MGDLGAVSSLSLPSPVCPSRPLAGVAKPRKPKGRLSPQGVARAAAAPLGAAQAAREVFPRPRGKSPYCGGIEWVLTGGSLNPQQPALIRGAMEKMPPGSVVLLAFDHDAGGEKLAEEVQGFAPSGVEVRRVLPPVGTGKDWNESLKNTLGLK